MFGPATVVATPVMAFFSAGSSLSGMFTSRLEFFSSVEFVVFVEFDEAFEG